MEHLVISNKDETLGSFFRWKLQTSKRQTREKEARKKKKKLKKILRFRTLCTPAERATAREAYKGRETYRKREKLHGGWECKTRAYHVCIPSPPVVMLHRSSSLDSYYMIFMLLVKSAVVRWSLVVAACLPPSWSLPLGFSILTSKTLELYSFLVLLWLCCCFCLLIKLLPITCHPLPVSYPILLLSFFFFFFRVGWLMALFGYFYF